ncbi:MAG TPA: tRNA (adenosine(37)-N6)-threonylcarbamoyltransferase complex dimerization subunit type 1 TsaB [Lacipirellulaceae bacterium]|jgi:tRNA threonylcarbamoyladenosine biosynthesis protein TsaB
MRIIAIETSGQAGSVAALEAMGSELRLLREATLSGGSRTAQSLAPLTRQLLADAGWSAKSIELVAVAVGPGSFTGLRIGVTMAKTFAYVVEAQIIGINTLEVVADQARIAAGALWAVMDAQRQELFAAKFVAVAKSQRMTLATETRVVSQADWLAALEPADTVIGPGLRRLVALPPSGIAIADESLWQPMASTVGRVGWRDFEAGRRDDVWKLMPHYFRASAAEEKLRR